MQGISKNLKFIPTGLKLIEAKKIFLAYYPRLKQIFFNASLIRLNLKLLEMPFSLRMNFLLLRRKFKNRDGQRKGMAQCYK